MRKLGVNRSAENDFLLLKEYFIGRNESIQKEDMDFINHVKELFDSQNATGFVQHSRQACQNQVIAQEYNDTTISFMDYDGSLGPWQLNTDFGICCMMQPHITLQKIGANEKIFKIDTSAKIGESNGIRILIDAEVFNHGIDKNHGIGFKIALYEIGDKPIIQFSSKLISTGSEVQISIAPSLSITTDEAISRLTPEKRNCYNESETALTFLKKSHGYKYSFTTCLYNELLKEIIFDCRCYPIFFVESFFPDVTKDIESCSGEGLFCAQHKIKQLTSLHKNMEVDNTSKLNNTIGNIARPSKVNCLPACQVQDNAIETSYIEYPSIKPFFYQDSFCYTAIHILHVTCKDEDRRYFLHQDYPFLCDILEYDKSIFGKNSSCQNWPSTYFSEHESINKTLEQAMYLYGRENLALLHVFIQSPQITEVKRDIAITFTVFLGNVGGILGLWLGFSVFSCLELAYWFCLCCHCNKKNYF